MPEWAEPPDPAADWNILPGEFSQQIRGAGGPSLKRQDFASDGLTLRFP